jgi:hypothetical protein
MPWFIVSCYTDNAKREGEPQRIEAATALEAAEKTCGSPLIESKGLDVRAVVFRLDNKKKTVFRHRPSFTR